MPPRLGKLGSNFPEDRFEKIYTKFLEVADKKSEIVDDDLRVLVESA